MPLAASVIVPTKARPDYLRQALASLARQDLGTGVYEVIVVDDDPSAGTRDVVDRAAREGDAPIAYIERAGPPGLNSARNSGIAAARGELIVLVDDDIEAPQGWLRELVEGARRHSGSQVFGGPIRLRLEGSRLRMCGREAPPITTLDAGPDDREVDLVWGANMAFDRRALELAGKFDTGVPYGFDEDMWERRLREAGGSVYYIARAGLDHRRDTHDAKLRRLLRESYRRGRRLRTYNEFCGEAPGIARELRVLAGCFVHTFRYRCANGMLLTAHSLGRLREAL